jgi:hypothetical protein
MGDYDTQLHLHAKEHPDIHGVCQRLREVLDDYGSGSRSRLCVGEVHVFDLVERHGALVAARSSQLIDRIATALPPGAWLGGSRGVVDPNDIVARAV